MSPKLQKKVCRSALKATAKTIVIAKLVFRATTTVAASVTSVTMFVVIKAGAAMEIITQQGAASRMRYMRGDTG